MYFCADASIDDFPRMENEKDDAPRFQRAIDACPNGELYVPAGIYEIAQPLSVKNLCSIRMHKSAILRAVQKMDFVLNINCRKQHTERDAGAPEDYNLFLKGGQIDGNGLASCLALSHYHHFTFADTTILNGFPYGVQVDENQSYGYELIVNNVYCKTVICGLAGNVAFYICGGDSHYTDIVVVDYTIGFRCVEHGWANRFTRCHVWGGPVPPAKEGEYPEMLKDSICFDLNVGGNILQDCYADTGVIGYRINSFTRMFGCTYFSNPKFGLDDIVCIKHVSGELLVSGNSFHKTAPSVTIYEGDENCREKLIWQHNFTPGFSQEELPDFAKDCGKADSFRMA